MGASRRLFDEFAFNGGSVEIELKCGKIKMGAISI